MRPTTQIPAANPDYSWQRSAIYALVAANVLLVTGFWWHSSGPEALRGSYSLMRAISRWCGLMGALSIMLDFISMVRLGILERALGRAKQVRLHKWLGYAAFGFILLHFTLLSIGYAVVDRLSIVGQFLSFTLTYPDVYQAVIAVVLLILVVGLSVWIVRRHLKYETWYYAHLLSYLVILLAFSHQMKVGPDFLGQPLFRAYWWLLYILTFLLVVVYRFGMPVGRSLYHGLTVERVVAETHDTFSIYVTGRRLERLQFRGGQFAIWWFLDNQRWWQGHPFSFSAAADGRRLRLTFKQSGDYTAVLPQLQPGTPVVMDGPYGIFTAEAIVRPKLLMIAGGIGLTPIAAMLREAAAAAQDIVLLYSVRTDNDLALKTELDEYAKELGVKVVYVVTQPPVPAGAISGLIDRDKLSQLVPDVASREVFLCGPPPMMAALKKALVDLGTNKNLINTEDFSF